MDQAAVRARAKRKAQLRAALLRQTLRWHWISAAICLTGMLLFAATGFTLNHAETLEGSSRVSEQKGTLPAPVLSELRAAQPGPLPDSVRGWAVEALTLSIPAGLAVEWSPGEAYLALPRPGADAWISIDLETGEALYERTDRGAVAFLNDLHKGRNIGPAWRLFIDAFALGCVVFCVTGLILLQLHAHARPSTWPLVALGLAVPFLLVLVLIH